MDPVNGTTAARAGVAGLLGVTFSVIGWQWWLCIAWAACMVLDYATGTAAAVKKHEWTSSRAREGLWHKGGEAAIVLVCLLLDFGLTLAADNMEMFAVFLAGMQVSLFFPISLVWYIITELGSVIENAASLGANVPKWLKRLVSRLGQGAEDAGGKASGEDEEKRE